MQDTCLHVEFLTHESGCCCVRVQFFLDLVNSDFSDEAAVAEILDTWEEKGGGGALSSHHSGHGKSELDEDDEGVVNMEKKSIGPEITILFRRHFALIIRDPILYIGRCIVFLVSCLIFSLVYLKARKDDQDQVQNKFWLSIWVCPSHVFQVSAG